MNILRLLFGLRSRVTRKAYLITGLALLPLKYLGESALYYLAKGAVLTPLEFFSPLLTSRYPGFMSLPDWFGPAVVVWTLPFLWIGVGMSIRRAADAELSPWLGILFFIPGVNYLLMAALSAIPTSTKSTWGQESSKAEIFRVISPLALTIVFALAGTFLVWFSTNFLRTYATALFVGSPFILGLVQGYILNFKAPRSTSSTAGYVALTVLTIHLFLLLFALEGFICLAMSLPISGVLSFMGAVFGAGMARYTKPRMLSPMIVLFAVPLMSTFESMHLTPHEDVVLSIAEIDVPPAKVWPNVVKFSDLPKSNDWLFKLGVAHPLRARIDGEGVGAVRHCEFSTGAFVEPITTWDEPRRLAFDVRYQPQPMHELSIYDHVDAPHLNGYFRSVRGEFKLVELPGGRTRLEGRTWYEMDMHPGWYWQLYGRWFIHKIHLRVLNHVKNLSEQT